jgi:Sulfotransferase domain
MALQVIGAGFGRTGTLSLKLALEQLGYVKCHHMVEVFASRDQASMWKQLADGEKLDWEKVFAGFAACVDFPACAFYRELAERYPDAKVILTVRSSDSWWRSASQTIFAIGKATPFWLPMLVPRLGKVFAMHDKLLWAKVFGGKANDEAAAKAVYERHNAEVKALIPPGRLLVYQVSQGWAPLCAFLGKPVPETAFPNVNDTAEFTKRIRAMKTLRWAPWVVAAIVASAALYVALTSGVGRT